MPDRCQPLHTRSNRHVTDEVDQAEGERDVSALVASTSRLVDLIDRLCAISQSRVIFMVSGRVRTFEDLDYPGEDGPRWSEMVSDVVRKHDQDSPFASLYHHPNDQSCRVRRQLEWHGLCSDHRTHNANLQSAPLL